MKRGLLLMAACAAQGAQGCDVGGYSVEQNVTVPAEVQRVFSTSSPGFVMNRDSIIGVLCAPKDEPVILHRRIGKPHQSCEYYKGFEDDVSGTVYAFRPGGDDLQRLDARTHDVLACGQSGPVEDSQARKEIFESHLFNSVEEERYLAVGSAKGECVSSSRYVVNITLGLKLAQLF